MQVIKLGALAILMAAALFVPRATTAADPCAAPTVPGLVGTAGNDVIRGTAGNDVLKGYGGNDTLCGLGGNDTLQGDQGNDRLYGGIGDDTLYGSYGDDRLYGQGGNDTFYGGTNDALENDACFGGPGVRDRDPERDCDTRVAIEL